jgi:hypothetical protein
MIAATLDKEIGACFCLVKSVALMSDLSHRRWERDMRVFRGGAVVSALADDGGRDRIVEPFASTQTAP